MSTQDAKKKPGNKGCYMPEPDLGFELLKTGVAASLRDIITVKELTQQQAAEITGISQPRISQLMNGKLQDVSVGAMLLVLCRLGRRVEVHVLP